MSAPATPPLDDGPQAGEPALAMGARGSIIGAVLALGIAFGLHLTGQQQTAILGAATVLGPILTAWAARSQVYSPESVRLLLGRAETDTQPEPETEK